MILEQGKARLADITIEPTFSYDVSFLFPSIYFQKFITLITSPGIAWYSVIVSEIMLTHIYRNNGV